MHIAGHGDAVQLATAIHDALSESKTPLAAPTPPAAPPAIDLDTAELEKIMGVKGNNNGGVYAFGVPRRNQITQAGMALTPPGPLGVATGVGFQPTGNGKAAITGDFVLLGDEVNPVIKTLRQSGIEVTALHSHMLNEEPRLFFMHFWANDDAREAREGHPCRPRQDRLGKQLSLHYSLALRGTDPAPDPFCLQVRPCPASTSRNPSLHCVSRCSPCPTRARSTMTSRAQRSSNASRRPATPLRRARSSPTTWRRSASR
jgi:hypothetical protein